VIITGIVASGISGHLSTNNFTSIQTVTVGSGGASSISFSSIPSTYTHLQIRGIGAANSSSQKQLVIQLNGDSTAGHYADHLLVGDGSTASAGNDTGLGAMYFDRLSPGSSSSAFGAFVIDILDYANTNKNKTVRVLGGWDGNGSGQIALGSGLWMQTSAVNSVTLFSDGAVNINQYSQFALYGVK